MPKGLPQIPKKYTIAPDWLIQVKQVNADLWPAVVGEAKPADSGGCWIKEHKTIYLDASQPLAYRWRYLTEELAHAVIDCLGER